MSTRQVTRSSQSVNSKWPEHAIEEKDNDAEEDDKDESLHDEETQEQEHLATIREEDKVDIMNILFTMQDMQKKIDLLMKKHGLTEDREAVVVSP